MEVNLKYLAGLAGVSVSTVSRALNGDPRVKPETAQKIKELAETFNYVPNHTAQSLVTGKTKTIGLVLPNIRAFMHDILDGIESVFSSHGINIILGVYNNDGNKEVRELTLLLKKRVDGIILFHIGSNFDHKVCTLLKNTNVPVVLLDRKIEGLDCDSVLNNNMAGSSLLVSDAVESGCKKVAFIYENEDVTTMQQRVEGFISAQEVFGLEYKSEYLMTSRNKKIKNGYESMKALCNLVDPPDAVIGSTGDNVMGIIRYLIDNPSFMNKIRVGGFDNFEFSDLLRVDVTNLDMCEFTVGKCSAELLLDRINGSVENIKTEIIEPQIKRRNR